MMSGPRTTTAFFFHCLVLLEWTILLTALDFGVHINCRELIPDDYKKYKPPPNLQDDEPTKIFIQFYVIDLDEVNENTMDFRLHTYSGASWYDSRLIKSNSSQSFDQCYRFLWTPDLMFEEAKTTEIVGTASTYFHVADDGLLYMTERIVFKVNCLMDLNSYPFDSQTCPFSISFMYTLDTDAVLRWFDDPQSPYVGTDKSKPITLMKEIEPLQFLIMEPTTGITQKEFLYSNFTYLVANFHLCRRLTGSICNSYAPSTLIVIVSWVTFWLRVDAAPDRVTLSITSMLTLCAQVHQYKSQLPPVNYITAMDIWFFVCIFMVFGTLVEFAISYNMYSGVKPVKSEMENNMIQIGKPSSPTDKIMKRWPEDFTDNFDKNKIGKTGVLGKHFQEPPEEVNKIDAVSRVLFPCLFISFAIFYWSYYTLF